MAMGYNASKKALSVAEKLEYVLAYELLSSYAAQQFIDSSIKRSPATGAVLEELKNRIPALDKDLFYHPYICYLKEMIHSGSLVDLVENVVGEMI